MFIVIRQIDRQARTVAHREIDQSLTQSALILRTRLDGRFRTIYETAQNLVRDGRLYQEVLNKDSSTLLDLSEELEKALDFDILMILDADGMLLARSDRPGAARRSLAGRSHLIDGALAGETTQGFMNRRGELLQIVAVPFKDLATPGLVRGVLSLAYRFSPALMNEINDTTECDLALFTFRAEPGEDGRAVVSPESFASTLPDGENWPSDYLETNPAIWKKLFENEPVEREVLQTGDDVLYCMFHALPRSDGVPVGFVMALRSKSELMRPFTTIRQTALWSGGFCLLAACGVSYLIARHIGGPVIRLVDITKRIQQGTFYDEKPLQRGDEVGVLNRAVLSMGKELREKAELEQYLADASDQIWHRESVMVPDVGAEPGPADVAPPTKTVTLETIRETNESDRGESVAKTVPMSTAKMAQGSAVSPKPMDDEYVGTLFSNRYSIVSRLGEGATGLVYLAKDEELNELVALKLILGARMSEESIDRLKQELRLARRIAHPNVVRNFDFGAHAGLQYISMEYIQGFTLSDLLDRKGPMALRMGLMMARQMCSAIGAAHLEGIVHRDLKPQNMMITRRGILKIMDFGIASTVSELARFEAENPARIQVSGTPQFMSPEQFEGRDVDTRTDIYALGIILFYLFSETPPFRGASLKDYSRMHREQEAPRLKTILPDAPDALDALIAKTLHKDKNHRFQNINQVSAALHAIQESLTET